MIFSLPIAFIIYKLFGTLFAIIFLFVVVAGTVISIVKDDNNLCVSKQIKFMIKYLKMQRKFKYKYYDKRRENK